MRGRWAGVAVVLLGALTPWVGSGCSSCAESCPAPRSADLVVFGDVVSVGDDAVVRFELDDGQQLDVLVTGSESGLYEGIRYRVPLFGSASGPPTASMPPRCGGCGPFITLPDGSEVDVAAPSIRLRVLTAAVVGCAAAVVGLWALVRWRRGNPL